MYILGINGSFKSYTVKFCIILPVCVCYWQYYITYSLICIANFIKPKLIINLIILFIFYYCILLPPLFRLSHITFILTDFHLMIVKPLEYVEIFSHPYILFGLCKSDHSRSSFRLPVFQPLSKHLPQI